MLRTPLVTNCAIELPISDSADAGASFTNFGDGFCTFI